MPRLRIPGLLLCLLAATPAPAQLSADRGRPGERPMPAEAARAAIEACANPSLPVSGDLTPNDVAFLGYGLTHPGAPPAYCRRVDGAAAIALLEAYAGDPIPLDTGGQALLRLLELYPGTPDDPRAAARRDEIRRVLWLRGLHAPPAGDPLLTAAEQQRLLSDRRNLEFLRAWVAADGADSAARTRLAQALLLEGSPQFDPVAAAAVMPEEWVTSELRLRLIAALLADPRSFDLAFQQLRFVYRQREAPSAPVAAAMAALLDRASRLLEREGTRLAGARVLGNLAETGVTEARRQVVAMIEREGGMLDAAGSPREIGRFADLISGDDYPAAAIRNLQEGVVRPYAIFGPDGRLVMIDTGPGEMTALEDAVARIWRRRWLQRVQLEGHRGRFVRIAGPAVEFRLADCPDRGVQPPRPANPDHVTVEGRCVRMPTLTTPVASTGSARRAAADPAGPA